MASKQRQFFANIKTITIRGDVKEDQLPQILVTLAIDLDHNTVKDVGFLAAAKHRGRIVATIESSQQVLPLDE